MSDLRLGLVVFLAALVADAVWHEWAYKLFD
jgi:hypothetical protein